ncbi:MAG: hypothetical protein M3N50_09100, partial [Pseudomonadota bacterium]|nr:hypothetical protein [Pseudomonadota bacterium]
MNSQWRLFLAALRFCTRSTQGALGDADIAHLGAGARYVPIAGALVGAAGGVVYWLGGLLWPTSIAVVLSLLATTVLTISNAHLLGFGLIGSVLLLLLKYNALMALSAASLPFALPANVALGFIMISGHAAGYALAVSLLAAAATDSSTSATSNIDLGVALAIGLAPAALLGIPGLIGLVAAILTRVAFGSHLKRDRK